MFRQTTQSGFFILKTCCFGNILWSTATTTFVPEINNKAADNNLINTVRTNKSPAGRG